MMRSVYLLLGTNQGNRENNLNKAIELLAERVAAVTALSSIYETAAWGETNQPGFLNQAVRLEADIDPEPLLRTIKEIEQTVGRTATYHWGPREIDIDILLIGDLVHSSHSLQIPHKELGNRRFALAPLCELAGNAVHPVTGLTISEMLIQCPDKLEVSKRMEL